MFYLVFSGISKQSLLTYTTKNARNVKGNTSLFFPGFRLPIVDIFGESSRGLSWWVKMSFQLQRRVLDWSLSVLMKRELIWKASFKIGTVS